MRSTLFALALLAACKRTQPDAPRPVARPDVNAAPHIEAPPPPSAPIDAGSVVVAIVRVRNISNVPITITTNADLNEMVHTWRLNVDDARSDRALIYLNDSAQLTRVRLFPIDLPRCDSDAATGFGGLGETRPITLAPGATFDVGTWDGVLREEAIDPERGACLREIAAPPGRYRLHFDQPRQTRPECQRALLRYPIASDGGVPVIELRCQPRPDGAPDTEE